MKNDKLIHKKIYNQYFTSKRLLSIISNNVRRFDKSDISIMDPGAGCGSLSISAIKNIIANSKKVRFIKLITYEIDDYLILSLKHNLNALKKFGLMNNVAITYKIINSDFLISKELRKYDLIIMNPPYKKINQSSKYSELLKKYSVNTTNTYTSFMKKALGQLKTEGQLLSITPRSFMNGFYFKKFRKWLFTNFCFNQILVFDSRRLFDGVLQEIVITDFRNKHQNKNICIQYIGKGDNKIGKKIVANYYDVYESTGEVIRLIRNYTDLNEIRIMDTKNSLQDLGVSVSTGPVVRYRQKPVDLSKHYKRGFYPYIFGEHFNDNMELDWPKKKVKKSNYLRMTKENSSLFREESIYVLVKRITAKEDHKRVKAIVLDSNLNYSKIAFDNSINYLFFNNQYNLNIDIAYGLCVYLNSSLFNKMFRQVSGNTQVNIFDLNMLSYPTLEELKLLSSGIHENQNIIDKLVNRVVLNNRSGNYES